MPYQPLADFITSDDDRSSARVRDMPYGKKRQKLTHYPSEIQFGEIALNYTSPAQTILLKNDGYDTIFIDGLIPIGDFNDATPSFSEILPGETVALSVTFHPTKIGEIIGGLHIVSEEAAGHKFIKLTGSGVLSETGLSQFYSLTESEINIDTGVYALIVAGTFDGASAQLQWRVDSSSPWIEITGALLSSSDAIYGIPLNSGQARLVISDATELTSITAQLVW